MRVIASDEGLREADSADGRRRYRRDSGGGFEVAKSDVQAMLDWGCFIPSALGPIREPRKVGFRCTDCGFGTWFTTCSRCGGNAVRETA